MESSYLFSSGELKRKDNVLRMTNEKGLTKDLTVETLEEIYLFGEVRLNTSCLNYAGKLKIPIHFFDYYGHYTGSFYPKEGNIAGRILIKQVLFSEDKEKRLEIAKEILKSAVHNIQRNLRYYEEKQKVLRDEKKEIEKLRAHLDEASTIEMLMGVEGNIRKYYYDTWNTIVKQDIKFEKRVRRPPDNMINTLISFINSLIYTTVLSEIYKTYLNPTISFLHEPGMRRFSLCLDIAEIFKPLIGDRMIFSLLNKNMITEDDFEEDLNMCYLKEKGKRKIIENYEERLKRSIHHKNLKRKVSYRELIRLECFKLIKHINGEKPYDGFKLWW